MCGKVAKRLRRLAESMTVGKSQSMTRKVYRTMKEEYKRKKRNG